MTKRTPRPVLTISGRRARAVVNSYRAKLENGLANRMGRRRAAENAKRAAQGRAPIPGSAAIGTIEDEKQRTLVRMAGMHARKLWQQCELVRYFQVILSPREMSLIQIMLRDLISSLRPHITGVATYLHAELGRTPHYHVVFAVPQANIDRFLSAIENSKSIFWRRDAFLWCGNSDFLVRDGAREKIDKRNEPVHHSLDDLWRLLEYLFRTDTPSDAIETDAIGSAMQISRRRYCKLLTPFENLAANSPRAVRPKRRRNAAIKQGAAPRRGPPPKGPAGPPPKYAGTLKAASIALRRSKGAGRVDPRGASSSLGPAEAIAARALRRSGGNPGLIRLDVLPVLDRSRPRS